MSDEVGRQPRFYKLYMKRTGMLLCAGLVFLVSVSTGLAEGRASGEPRDASAVRRSIEAANATWMDAYRNGDTRAMSSIFTVNANLFPPSDVILEDRASIVEYFATQRGLGMRDLRLSTLEVVTMGEVAYEIGTYAVMFEDEEPAGRRSDAGRYFVIWRDDEKGGWHYQTGFWSSDARVGPPAGAANPIPKSIR
ncbi:MAG: ketosteroid isomerase-like protein [Hyphomicrobiaceae bacterium]